MFIHQVLFILQSETTTVIQPTTQPTTSSVQTFPPECVSGNLEERVCKIEEEQMEFRENIQELRDENQRLRDEINAVSDENEKLNATIEELQDNIKEQNKIFTKALDDLQDQILKLTTYPCIYP